MGPESRPVAGAPRHPEVRSRPRPGRVLVVAPHPDDETLGLGGTLALHARQGDAVTVVFLSSGIQGDPAGHIGAGGVEAVRESEARLAGAALGLRDLRFLGFPDNLADDELHVLFPGERLDGDEARRRVQHRIAEYVGGVIESEAIDIVYAPWTGEVHPDHWTVAEGVRRLRESQPALQQRVSFLEYDLWTPLVPDVVIDVTPVVASKQRAIRCYESQLRYQDFEAAVLGLDRHRALLVGGGATHAEAFRGNYLDAETGAS